ncbi:MAG: hypothetical protein RJB65_2246 [Actinomycetota bacterium]
MNDPTPDPALEHEQIPPHHAVVRAVLGEVDPAPHDHRERGIAAALAVFDAHHSVPSLDAARSARMSRARRWNMALAAAAAVVLLGIVGTGLLRGTTGNDQESASVMTVSASESGSASDAMVPSEQAGTGDQKTTTETMEGGQLEALTSTMPNPSETTASATVSTAGGIVGPAFVTPAVSTPEELLMLPESIPSDPSLAPLTDVFVCDLMPGDVVIGRITYSGLEAVAVRTNDGGVIAFDVECAVLAEAKP